MVANIHLEICIEDRIYRISEILDKNDFILSEHSLVIRDNVYRQLNQMLKRICQQCYIEEIENKRII